MFLFQFIKINKRLKTGRLTSSRNVQSLLPAESTENISGDGIADCSVRKFYLSDQFNAVSLMTTSLSIIPHFELINFHLIFYLGS